MGADYIRFGDFRVDVPALEVTREGKRLELSPGAVRVLIVLATRSGELVTRDELYASLWPGGGVDTERLLNTYIRQIRRALGEHDGDDRFIRTYPRRGYRFLPPTLGATESETRSAGAAPTRVGLEAVAMVGGTVAVLGVASAIVLAVAKRPATDDRPLATLQEPARIAFLVAQEMLRHPMPGQRAAATEHFRTVTRLEPDFAPGFTGLAESLMWSGRPDAAQAAARTAITLGSPDARTFMSLGTALLVGDWAWREAESELRRAVTLAGDDPAPHLALAFLLLSSGRHAEARVHLDQVRALAPASPDLTGDLGEFYGWLGDHAAALEMCRRTTRIEPRASWGHRCALSAGLALGRVDVVTTESAKLVELGGGSPDTVFANPDDVSDRITALRRFQLSRSGDASMSHFNRARLWIALGDQDRALDELEHAADRREPGFVAILGEPRFAALRNEERFERLVARLFAHRAAPTGAAPS